MNTRQTRFCLRHAFFPIPRTSQKTVHSHPASLSGSDKKIIGIKLDEKEKQIQVGKEREKGRSKLLYYSMGVHYHEVNKSFEFI